MINVNKEYAINKAENNGAIKETPLKGISLWRWSEDNKHYILIVKSTSRKNGRWGYSSTIENRDKAMAYYVSNLQKSLEYKEAKKQAKKAFKHSYNVGDILYSSWGYNQTNINFYQVTKLIGKTMIELTPIRQNHVQSEDIHDRVVADKDNFHGESMRCKVNVHNSVKINSYRYASMYDGRPLYQTNSLYGH